MHPHGDTAREITQLQWHAVVLPRRQIRLPIGWRFLPARSDCTFFGRTVERPLEPEPNQPDHTGPILSIVSSGLGVVSPLAAIGIALPLFFLPTDRPALTHPDSPGLTEPTCLCL